ncbi:hypothetical protein ACLOJK_029160 [Asimina triloba]
MTDPAIKLFGMTIPLRANEDVRVPSAAANDQLVETSFSTSSSSLSSSSSLHEERSQKAQQQPEKQEEDKDVSEQSPDDEEAEKKEWAGSSVCDHESMELAASTADGSNMETAPENDSKTHKEQSASNSKDQKTVKKPDKILPCPRCNSLDTKFCYYNNYNVNQPRHFCKNCQRYWTAGGTMRNVPVGAGRRKNKNSSSSHYRHMSLSEALQTARNEMPEAIFHPHIPLNPNGTVLSFGSDSPLCDSMASVLSLTEKAMPRNGFHRAEEERSLENGEEHSSGSSVTASNSSEEEPLARNCQGFAAAPPPLPCFPAAPWTYPWNSAQWSPLPPPPGFCASSFPIPFYPAPAPAAYWGCAIPGAWTTAWVSPAAAAASPTAPNGSGSASSAPTPNPPTLGKHAREGDALKEDSEKEEAAAALKEKKNTSSEGCLWIPKTLRIDDPGEAARSSIWATLGIKKGDDGISGGGLFKPFQSKAADQSSSNQKQHHNTQVLHANPAALSRSLHFQEIS